MQTFLPPRRLSSRSPSQLLNFNREASKWAAHWLRGSSNKPGASALQPSEGSPGPDGADQLKNLANSQLPHGHIWNDLEGPVCHSDFYIIIDSAKCTVELQLVSILL